ncbi:hypothetical protein FRX31_019696 [Thalictrum thalictroides]|uniref:Replication protein A 70 kDa DNA-binding subunit B/D first OB fold domain-containing protein n=1 Tax=Thalictrum thalictroides TaxID=46969 RepID=A0A7J6W184_THATH|nr:hypothetical protein FRX31_019696 [Thalictrum thalictroides]
MSTKSDSIKTVKDRYTLSQESFSKKSTMVREVSIDIRDIGRTNFEWKLTVRIMLLWKEINEETKEITYMHKILIDKNGHKIHAKLNGPNIGRIEVPLTEGKIYIIIKFKTWEINKGYRYAEYDYQIYLQQYSKLEFVEEATKTIPMHKFDFVNYSEVESYI